MPLYMYSSGDTVVLLLFRSYAESIVEDDPISDNMTL